jgi:hypothetical protein
MSEEIPNDRPRCELADYAFALSLISLLLCFFPGTFGAIACGHAAQRQIRNNPELAGADRAKWALIIGYASFLIFPILVFGFYWITGAPHGRAIWER